MVDDLEMFDCFVMVDGCKIVGCSDMAPGLCYR
jgi:hypothetical protein